MGAATMLKLALCLVGILGCAACSTNDLQRYVYNLGSQYSCAENLEGTPFGSADSLGCAYQGGSVMTFDQYQKATAELERL
jgi:hypothetical protein